MRGGVFVTRNSHRVRSRTRRRVRALSPRRVLMMGLLRLPTMRLRSHMRTRLLRGPTLRRNERRTTTSSPSRDGDGSLRTRDSTGRCSSLNSCLGRSSVPSCGLRRGGHSGNRRTRRVPFSSTASFCRVLERRLDRHGLARRRHRLTRCLVNSLSSSNLLHGSLRDVDSRLTVCTNVGTARRRLRRTLYVVRSFSPTKLNTHGLRRYLLVRLRQGLRGNGPSGTLVLRREVVGRYCRRFAHGR